MHLTPTSTHLRYCLYVPYTPWYIKKVISFLLILAGFDRIAQINICQLTLIYTIRRNRTHSHTRTLVSLICNASYVIPTASTCICIALQQQASIFNGKSEYKYVFKIDHTLTQQQVHASYL